jgi:hypothetical protein
MAFATTVLTLTLSLSAYAPESGDGISGGAKMANGERPHIGAAACPASIPLGSFVFLADDHVAELGLPMRLVCADRFAATYSSGHLDLCIPRGFNGMTDAERIALARMVGRSNTRVVFEVVKERAPVSMSRFAVN